MTDLVCRSTIGTVVEQKIPQGLPDGEVELTYVDISSIDNRRKRITDAKRLYVDEAPSRARQQLQKGDVIVSMTRPNLNAVALVTDEYIDAIGSTGFCVLRPIGVVPEWLYYRVQAMDFIHAMDSLVQGALYPAVRKKDVYAFPITVPSLETQKLVVDEIETQLARLDDAVAALQRARTRLKRYRASVLKAACEGRLVPTETHRSAWPVHRLGDHIERIEAGKNFRCDERPPTLEEVGIVKISAVTWGEYDEQESKTCRDISALRQELLVQPGDFLISRANTIELVGACVIASKVTLPVMLSDKVLRIRFGPELDQRWVLSYLRGPQGRQEIESRATGNQLSMRNIGQNRIKDIPIPVPPLKTQHLTIVELERRLSIADQLEMTVETNLKRAEALRQSILRKAFSGQLRCKANQ